MRATALAALERLLKLLHPVMPHVTEEIWTQLPARETRLIVAPWPEPRRRCDGDFGALDRAQTAARIYRRSQVRITLDGDALRIFEAVVRPTRRRAGRHRRRARAAAEGDRPRPRRCSRTRSSSRTPSRRPSRASARSLRNTLPSATRWVESLSPWPADGFGLERMRELLARLGNPERELDTIHVVGTKGKSTADAPARGDDRRPRVHVAARLAAGTSACRPTRSGFERAIERVRPGGGGARRDAVRDPHRGGVRRLRRERGRRRRRSRRGSAGGTTRRTSSTRASSSSRTSASSTPRCSATRARRSRARSSRSRGPGAVVVLPDEEFAHLVPDNDVRIGGRARGGRGVPRPRRRRCAEASLPGAVRARGSREIWDGAHTPRSGRLAARAASRSRAATSSSPRSSATRTPAGSSSGSRAPARRSSRPRARTIARSRPPSSPSSPRRTSSTSSPCPDPQCRAPRALELAGPDGRGARHGLPLSARRPLHAPCGDRLGCARERSRQLLSSGHSARSILELALAVSSSCLWLALGYWTYSDAQRRIEEPLLIGLATLVGLFPPFIGPFIYMLFRPPEYIDDRRERELEIRAIESRLAAADISCPVCHAEVDPSFLVCPVCTTKLKQACSSCNAPLEPIWQVCPYCETPMRDAAGRERRRRSARAARRDARRGPLRRLATVPPRWPSSRPSSSSSRTPCGGGSPAEILGRIEARGFEIREGEAPHREPRAGGGALRRAPREAVLRRARRLHRLRPDVGARGRGRGRDRDDACDDRRDRSRERGARNDPGRSRGLDARQPRARLRFA